MKFKNRPNVIEAEQYQVGSRIEGVLVYNIDEGAPCWFDDEYGHRYPARDGDAFIRKPRGDFHYVAPGDWVITGADGLKYPCKPAVFEATYEPAG